MSNIVKNNETENWYSIIDRGNIVSTTMDVINHPLDKKKSKVNLNAIVQYWQHKDSPFWVSGKYFRIHPSTLSEATHSQFIEALGKGNREYYELLWEMWQENSDPRLIQLSRLI